MSGGQHAEDINLSMGAQPGWEVEIKHEAGPEGVQREERFIWAGSPHFGNGTGCAL